MALITFRARLGFPSLWTPISVMGGPEKFRARIIVDPADKATVKLIRDTRKEVATAKWGKKAEGVLAAIAGDSHKDSWFESDYRSQDGDIFDGFEGMFHMSALSDVQPGIFDRDRTELTKRDGRPYSGCYCIFKVDIYAQDNASGKGMRAGLAGVQFWKDGDAFSGGTKAKAEDFDDLSEQGDDEPAPSKGAVTRAKAKAEEVDDDIA